MVNIWDFAGRGSCRVKITTTDGMEFSGTVADVEAAEEFGENEDGIVLSINKELIYFQVSEIESIVLIQQERR
jgi:hypothetical protein